MVKGARPLDFTDPKQQESIPYYRSYSSNLNVLGMKDAFLVTYITIGLRILLDPTYSYTPYSATQWITPPTSVVYLAERNRNKDVRSVLEREYSP